MRSPYPLHPSFAQNTEFSLFLYFLWRCATKEPDRTNG
jgi:hypothetical protein